MPATLCSVAASPAAPALFARAPRAGSLARRHPPASIRVASAATVRPALWELAPLAHPCCCSGSRGCSRCARRNSCTTGLSLRCGPQAPPAPLPAATPAGPKDALSSIASQLQGSDGTKQQMQLLLQFARRLDPFPEQERTYGNRVMGCTSQARPAAVPPVLLQVCSWPCCRSQAQRLCVPHPGTLWTCTAHALPAAGVGHGHNG